MADLNGSGNRMMDGNKKRTPLHFAAASNNQEMVQLLVQRGAQVGVEDDNVRGVCVTKNYMRMHWNLSLFTTTPTYRKFRDKLRCFWPPKMDTKTLFDFFFVIRTNSNSWTITKGHLSRQQ